MGQCGFLHCALTLTFRLYLGHFREIMMLNVSYALILALFSINMVYSFVGLSRNWVKPSSWRRTIDRAVRTRRQAIRRPTIINKSSNAVKITDYKAEEKPLVPYIFTNTVKKFSIDEAKFNADVNLIRKIIGIPHLDFTLWFCSYAKIREINKEERGKAKATDILSFPMFEFKEPEVVADPSLLSFNTFLGDIILSPEYVHKVILQDQEEYSANSSAASPGNTSDSEDRGVSRAMSTVFTLQDRLPLLMVHGLLHLVGYDHETDSDWELMTRREEEVIQQWTRLRGER